MRAGNGSRPMTLAIVGGGERAVSLARLLGELDSVCVGALCTTDSTTLTDRIATELGVYCTPDLTEVYQVPDLDLIVDMTTDDRVRTELEMQRPLSVAMTSGPGSDLLLELLAAKKRGDEQEKLFVELQVAYDKIRSHERRLQSSKEALVRANEELESRLAEIFFTHEFFKALTHFTSVEDVCSLIVDGCNGILGAEISCVYLFNREDWTLQLRACQGRASEAFRSVVPISETILGHAFREGPVQEAVIEEEASAGWFAEENGIKSQAALPLRTGGNVFGVMAIASATPRELSSAEMERLAVLGNQSSLCLQNALLHGELERLSVTDRLTELYNHGYFLQRLEEEINRSRRFSHCMSLIMLDIDDFKEFNDSYGHPRGDDVLRSVSAIIRGNLREMDIAARYGGEEFVVVLPETESTGACAVAERIRSGIEGVDEVPNGHGVRRRTVSIGVATFPQDGDSARDLLESADAAMYVAKRAGKNRVRAAG